MEFARVMTENGPSFGIVRGEEVELLTKFPVSATDYESTGRKVALSSVTLLAPSEPSKVVAVSSNYHAVLKAIGKEPPKEPLLFIKPGTSVVGPGEAIVIGGGSTFVTHEPELAIVIGKICKNVEEADVDDYVLGYTCANDVSSRDIQNVEVHMTRAKAFDTYCPLGPTIIPGLPDGVLGVRSLVNDELVLDTNTSDMIFPTRMLISFISKCMTLLPGDVISTGAGGVGPIVPGDVCSIEIDKVGRLSNPVRNP